jgi:hypothetical protein
LRAIYQVALDEIAQGAVPVGPQGLQDIVGQSATVVREAVIRALTHDTTPSLPLIPIPENPGRLLVPLDKLRAWAARVAGRLQVDPSIDVMEPVGRVPRRNEPRRAAAGDGGGRRQRWQMQGQEEGGKA